MKRLKALLVLGFFLMLPALSLAQPGLPEPQPQTPIDGGLAILAALGGGYAIKKLKDKNKQ